MNAKQLPSREHLHACFLIVDNALVWKTRPREHFKTDRAMAMWNAKFAGKRAGRPMSNGRGYWQVMVDGLRYLNHRVLAQMYGMDTTGVIDHKDGNPLNNAPSNLRPCSQAQNARNNGGWSRKSGRQGTFQCENGRWAAYIRSDGRLLRLGTFEREDQAISARVAAEAMHYGEFSVSASRGI